MTLVAQFNANADVAPEAFMNRAGVVAAIVDVVEAAGFSCHVITFAHSSRCERTCTQAITIKEPGEPVDAGRLAFGMGHPALLRRIGFAGYASHPELKVWGQGMGSRASLDASELPANTYMLSVGDPSMDGAFYSEKAAVEIGLPRLVALLKKQGCPAFTEEN